MSIQFRKSKTIGGFRFNFGKKGLSSVSFGKKGARISIDKKGKVSRTIGITGTGIYSRKTIGKIELPENTNINKVTDTTANTNIETNNTNYLPENLPNNTSPRSHKKIFLIVSIILFIFAFIMFLCGISTDSHPAETIGIPLFFVGIGCFFLAKYKHAKNITCIICIGISIFGFIITGIAPPAASENNNETFSIDTSVSSTNDITSENAISTDENSISSTENTTSENENTSSKASGNDTNSSASSSTNNLQSETNQSTAVQSSNIQSQTTYPITVINELSFSRNEYATVSINGQPNTEYNIKVYYSSGASTADGLESKTSDSNGDVSWTWKIGCKTNPGTYRLVIKGGNETIEKNFTVN